MDGAGLLIYGTVLSNAASPAAWLPPHCSPTEYHSLDRAYITLLRRKAQLKQKKAQTLEIGTCVILRLSFVHTSS